MQEKSLTKILTFCGSIPFIVSAVLLIINQERLLSLRVDLILSTYAAIILSFISGIHFGYAILQKQFNKRLLIISNIIALIAWFSLLVSSFEITLIILIICYLTVLIIDYYLFKAKLIKEWFFNLRVKITVIVVLFLALSLAL